MTDYLAYTMTQLGIVHRHADEFDLVHNHLDYVAFATAQLDRTPTVTTTHGRLDLPEVRRVYADFVEQPLVAISNDQRGFSPTPTGRRPSRTLSTSPTTASGPNLALPRVPREDQSGEAPRPRHRNCAGRRHAPGHGGQVDAVDRDHYEHAIAPVIRANPSLVEFVGEVNEEEKDALLGEAWAYLFPIDWPEPFGLTMAEAMATGTPVVAYRAGSVPEVVEHGVTGFVCTTAGEMAAAVGRVGEISRSACRERVERLFSPAAMADGYERAYPAVLAGRSEPRSPVANQFATLPPGHRMSLGQVSARRAGVPAPV